MEKGSFLRKIKYFFTSRRTDARLLDYMKEHPEAVPGAPKAPSGEFEKIMAEMERRGIEPRIHRQAQGSSRIIQFFHTIPRPIIAALAILFFVGGTSVVVSAKKSYDYRMREKDPGGMKVIWNNDDHIITEQDGLDKAYEKIETSLEIKPLKMAWMPFELKYRELTIENGDATLKFTYNDKNFYVIEAKYATRASNGLVSDRTKYKEVFNEILQQTFYIEKNDLPDGTTEFSTDIGILGSYYQLSGILPEEEFKKIVENLSF